MYNERDAYDLLKLRYQQHVINEQLKDGLYKNIPVHLDFGQEALALGLVHCLQKMDKVCLTHRNVGINLASCGSVQMILEHYSLQHPPHMGSMNLVVTGTPVIYSSNILGNNLAVASGIAMNRKIRNDKSVIFACSGDGAIEEGVFWETLIFARSYNLPLVIIIENNDHSMASSIDERRHGINFGDVCDSMSISYFRGDGAILPAVTEILSESRSIAEKGNLAVVEFDITAFCQHAGPTPGWPTDPKKIDLSNGLLLANSIIDPLYHCQASIGQQEFKRLELEIISEGIK